LKGRNELIREVLTLLDGEIRTQRVSVETELIERGRAPEFEARAGSASITKPIGSAFVMVPPRR